MLRDFAETHGLELCPAEHVLDSPGGPFGAECFEFTYTRIPVEGRDPFSKPFLLLTSVLFSQPS